MSLIADGLMIAAALVSAIYCHVLAGRLRKLKELDGGVGQAIAALVAQVRAPTRVENGSMSWFSVHKHLGGAT